MDLGIDIGGTYIKYGWVDENNNIINRVQKETRCFNKTQAFFDYLLEDIDLDGVTQIGVSAPGIVGVGGIMMTKASPNTWDIFHSSIPGQIKKRTNLPCKVINDAKAAGFCELLIGNGRKTSSSVYFIIGTGIGTCFCDQGAIKWGLNVITSELISLPPGFNENGHLVTVYEKASITSLVTLYNQQVQPDKRVQFGKDVEKRRLEGEKEALKAFDLWFENILDAFEMIQALYNPEVICIGGGISESCWFINTLIEKEKLRNGNIPHKFSRLEKCRFENDANLLGAVLFARSKFVEGQKYKVR